MFSLDEGLINIASSTGTHHKTRENVVFSEFKSFNYFDRLPRLKILDISSNSITDISGVEKLPSCVKLIANRNEVVIMPHEMR